jgi:hypothetical protein
MYTLTTRLRMCAKHRTLVREPWNPSRSSPSSSTRVLLFEALSATNARIYIASKLSMVFWRRTHVIYTYLVLYAILVQTLRDVSSNIDTCMPLWCPVKDISKVAKIIKCSHVLDEIKYGWSDAAISASPMNGEAHKGDDVRKSPTICA